LLRREIEIGTPKPAPAAAIMAGPPVERGWLISLSEPVS
jgi:hypothetical protein